MDWEGLIVIYLICAGIWLVGRSNHRRLANNDADKVIISRLFAPLFGKTGTSQFSIRGIIAQLSAYLVGIIFTLDLGKMITHDITIRLFGVAGVLLVILGLWMIAIRR